MAETLSQEEIDALREAVKSGEELEGTGDAPAEEGQVKVTEYNFKRPRIISGESFHALRLVHESFSNSLRVGLFSILKTNVETKLVALDQLTYGEFVLSLSNPSYLAVLGTAPDIGEIEMELNLSIATAMIDILLGGNGSFSFEDRGLTALETDILRGVNDAIMTELKNAWSNITDMTFNVTTLESNPEYIQIAQSATPCVNVTIDMHIGDLAGVMTLCYPAHTIATAFDKAEERSAKKRAAEGDKGDAKKVRDAIEAVPLRLGAVIGPAPITAQQVESLKPGDIIDLGRRVTRPIDVYIDNRRAYAAELGRNDGKTAVYLLNAYTVHNDKKE